MTVSVNIQTGAQASAIVVPNDALANLDGEHPHVWVVEQGRAVRRELQLGLRGLVQTQVTAGLQAGDWVLADAQAPWSRASACAYWSAHCHGPHHEPPAHAPARRGTAMGMASVD